ncbi:MAG: PQQ-dependent sugar dehydrogenase, partial [Candidatus Nanopelagicales bacterium]
MHLGPRARLIAITSAVLVIVGALSIGGVLAFGPLFPAANAQPTVDLVSKKTVARSLTSPWGLAFLPDGSALVSERDTGLVRRIAGRSNGSPARSLTKTSTVGTVSGVRAGGEGGLLGIAVPPTPRGTQPEVIFAYLTTARDNRVVRIAWDGRSLGRQTPIVTGIPKNTYHNGGRILVDDDVLYIATGDAGIPELAQDRTSLAGKVLRVDFDGAPAAGNPIDGSRIFTLGHR